MSLQAQLETLDTDMREWRVRGMNGTPEERAKFLKSCFHGARFNMRAALLATPILRPGMTQREMYDELVPKVLDNVAEQGRNSGYTAEQLELYINAHRRAYDALAGEFGFVDMTEDEIESLKDF